MRGRKLRLTLWALAGALLLVYLWREYWSEVPALTVSFGEYCRVQRGMTRAEVGAVFGGPPTSRRSRAGCWLEGAVTTWEGCAGSADIVFDDGGKVVDKCYCIQSDWDRADPASKEQIRREWRESLRGRYRILE
jgi:hypothetical protein